MYDIVVVECESEKEVKSRNWYGYEAERGGERLARTLFKS